MTWLYLINSFFGLCFNKNTEVKDFLFLLTVCCICISHCQWTHGFFPLFLPQEHLICLSNLGMQQDGKRCRKWDYMAHWEAWWRSCNEWFLQINVINTNITNSLFFIVNISNILDKKKIVKIYKQPQNGYINLNAVTSRANILHPFPPLIIYKSGMLIQKCVLREKALRGGQSTDY